MNEWYGDWLQRRGDVSTSLADTLEQAIRSGRLPAGSRLPTHRDLSKRLGVAVSTVTRAYAEATRRGLVDATVGRGTFVQRRHGAVRGLGPSEATINLALNVPPYTGEDDIIATALAEIVAEGEMSNLLGYLPHQGLRRHREAMVTWVQRTLPDAVPVQRVRMTDASGAAPADDPAARPHDGLFTGSVEAERRASTFTNAIQVVRESDAER